MLLYVIRLPVLALCLLGCLPNPDEGNFDVGVPPASCGNGRCEAAGGESCVNCPKDCSCCAATFAAGNGAGAENAVGRPDGARAELAAGQSLELTLGRAVEDGSGPDLEVVAIVETGQPQPAGCMTSAQGDGAIQVRVRDEASGAWRTLGQLTKGGAASFDLACGLARHASLVRLEALAGARAQIDAVRALACTE
jgi:hypothetical protein